jgi:hypothetical protein
MIYKIQIDGLAPICEGSEENDIVSEVFEIKALDIGMAVVKAEMRFRKMGPRRYPVYINLVE